MRIRCDGEGRFLETKVFGIHLTVVAGADNLTGHLVANYNQG